MPNAIPNEKKIRQAFTRTLDKLFERLPRKEQEKNIKRLLQAMSIFCRGKLGRPHKADPVIDEHNDMLLRSELLRLERFRQKAEEERKAKFLAEAPNLSIGNVEFSFRTRNCLEQAGLTTIREVAALKPSDLLAMKNVNKKVFFEVREKLSELGLSLKDDENALPVQQ